MVQGIFEIHGNVAVDSTGARRPIIEDTFDLPGHFKRVIHGKRGAETMLIVNVFNSGVGWVKYGTDEATPSKSPCTDRAEHIFAALCNFTTASSVENELKRMPDEMFDDRDAAVIKGKTPEGYDTNMYFDKQTGLSIGTREQEPVPGMATPVIKTVFLRNHKTIQGGVYPTTDQSATRYQGRCKRDDTGNEVSG